MSIFNMGGTPKERRTQLYFRDDGAFQFRQLDIEDGFLVERNAKKEITKAWMMKYGLLLRFNGFKNIKKDMITPSFGRDIIFDPHDKLGTGEKPEKGNKIIKSFITKIATAKCYRHEQKAKGNLMIDKMVLFMGFTMLLLAIGIGLKVAF